MRELHHSGTSNRFHDLADIVMILLMQPVSAGDLAEKCRHEAQRRGLEVPESLWVPEDFGAGFDRNSNDYFGLPEDFKKFDRAFEYAEKILNPVLNGVLESANWDPQGQEWVD